MRKIFIVERHHNGSVGRKEFRTRTEAEMWLSSDRVREDERYGASFKLIEKVVEDK